MKASPCDTIFPDLSAHLDGEAGAAATARLESHLTQCPTCQDRRHGLLLLREALTGAAAGEAPIDFADRTARLVIERSAPPRAALWTRLRLGADGWIRAAAAAVVGLSLTASGALSAGSVLHDLATPGGSVRMTPGFTAPARAELARWDRILPHLATAHATWTAAFVLSLLVLLGGAAALGLPALIGDLRRGQRIRVGRAAGIFLALYGLGALALLPVAIPYYVVDLPLRGGTWSDTTMLSALALAAALWGGLVALAALVCLLGRSVRGVPAGVAAFAACWAVGWGTERLHGWLAALAVTWTPRPGLPIPPEMRIWGAVGLPAVVLSPGSLAGEIVLAGAAIGAAAALLLAGPLSYAPALRRPGSAGILAAIVLAAWGFHAARAAHRLRLGSPPVAAAAAPIPRTVVLLLPDDSGHRHVKTHDHPAGNGRRAISDRTGLALKTVPYPVPAELVGLAATPTFQRAQEGRFTAYTPWAYGRAMDRAYLDWDTSRILALADRLMPRVPGANYGLYALLGQLTDSASDDWWSTTGLTTKHVSAPVRARIIRWRTEFAVPAPWREEAPGGSIRGRILIGGRPAAGLAIRLLNDVPYRRALGQSPAAIRRMLADRLARELKDDVFVARLRAAVCPGPMGGYPFPEEIPRAQRTAADGSFRFTDLAPQGYVLAIMLPGRVPDVQVQSRLDVELKDAGVADVEAAVNRAIDRTAGVIEVGRGGAVNLGDLHLVEAPVW